MLLLCPGLGGNYLLHQARLVWIIFLSYSFNKLYQSLKCAIGSNSCYLNIYNKSKVKIWLIIFNEKENRLNI